MPSFLSALDTTLGLGRDATALTFLQVSLRGVIVFIATLVIIRCGDRRFLSQKTAFDAVLGFILASMLARAVNGTAAFFPTLGGGFVLVMLHRVLASWARRSHVLGDFIKGRSDVLIRDGKLDQELATRNRLSERDGGSAPPWQRPRYRRCLNRGARTQRTDQRCAAQVLISYGTD
jgi:hypothetical protein